MYLGVDIFVNKSSTVMLADLRPELIAWEIFLSDEPWIGHSGDDKDDGPCLNEALLQVDS